MFSVRVLKKSVLITIALYLIITPFAVHADTYEIGSLGEKLTAYYVPVYKGIDFTPVFDVEYYYNSNPDLQVSIGKKDNELFQHFISSGMREGRAGSPYFDVNVYIQQNPDLYKQYGNELDQYYINYVTKGWSEGRVACKNGKDIQPNCIAFYKRIITNIEKSAAEKANIINSNNNGNEYQVGWNFTDIGYIYDTEEHVQEMRKYAEKAAAYVCAEYPKCNWHTEYNVSNISWSKNPYAWGDEEMFVGEKFLSSGYLWIGGK